MTGDETVVEREKQIEEILVSYGKMALASGATPKYGRREKKALRLWDEAEEIEIELALSLGIPPTRKRDQSDQLTDRDWVKQQSFTAPYSGRAQPAGRFAEHNLITSMGGAKAGFQWNVMHYFDRIVKLRTKAKNLFPQVGAHYRTLTEPLVSQEE